MRLCPAGAPAPSQTPLPQPPGPCTSPSRALSSPCLLGSQRGPAPQLSARQTGCFAHQPRTSAELSFTSGSRELPASPSLAGKAPRARSASPRGLTKPLGQAWCRTGTVVTMSPVHHSRDARLREARGVEQRQRPPRRRAAVPTPGHGCCQQWAKPCRNISRQAFEARRRCWEMEGCPGRRSRGAAEERNCLFHSSVPGSHSSRLLLPFLAAAAAWPSSFLQLWRTSWCSCPWPSGTSPAQEKDTRVCRHRPYRCGGVGQAGGDWLGRRGGSGGLARRP